MSGLATYQSTWWVMRWQWCWWSTGGYSGHINPWRTSQRSHFCWVWTERVDGQHGWVPSKSSFAWPRVPASTGEQTWMSTCDSVPAGCNTMPCWTQFESLWALTMVEILESSWGLGHAHVFKYTSNSLNFDRKNNLTPLDVILSIYGCSIWVKIFGTCRQTLKDLGAIEIVSDDEDCKTAPASASPMSQSMNDVIMQAIADFQKYLGCMYTHFPFILSETI